MPLTERPTRAAHGEASVADRTATDAAIVAVACIVGAAAAGYFDLFAAAHGPARDAGHWEIGAFAPIAVVVAVALAWFAFRRWRDARAAFAGLSRAREETLRLREQLGRARNKEAIGNLAGGISHEFGNLLLPILSMTEIMLRKLPADSPLRPNLEVVLEAARQSRSLIRQVLLYTGRADSGVQLLDLRDSVRDGVRFAAMVVPRTIDFKTNLGDDRVEVMADPTDIQQIVVDLVTQIAEVYHPRGIALDLDVENAVRAGTSGRGFRNGHDGPHAWLRVRHDGADGAEADPRDGSPGGPAAARHGAGECAIFPAVEALGNLGGGIVLETESGEGGAFGLCFPVFTEEGAYGQGTGG